MNLESLPDHKKSLIVVGTSVRKSVPVLTAYLQSLASQILPPQTRLHYVFVPDYPDRDPAEELLKSWVNERGGDILRAGPTTVGDYSDTGGPTHQWAPSAMGRVGRNKNAILQRARDLKADACFLADADLILDSTTLQSLWYTDAPVACGVYWTHWHKTGRETAQLHAAPQVWLNHPYQLEGRGYEPHEFREKLVNRQAIQVWGQGACTLIRKRVLDAGVDFSYVPGVSQEGMMAGEDRHFCIRCERGHLPMVADAWPDIFHIYHPEDQQRIPEMLERLTTPHPERPALGDWVSFTIQAMESVPNGQNSFMLVPKQSFRGRIGAMAMLPELEDALLDMTRGEERIVPFHFPAHYPLPYFRGRKRLHKVQLIDCKTYGFAPVLETELFISPRSRPIDMTTLTERQGQSIAGSDRVLDLVRDIDAGAMVGGVVGNNDGD